MNACIILWDHVFENYKAYNHCGHRGVSFASYEMAQRKVKEWDYIEVPINSKIGRQILARIGTRR